MPKQQLITPEKLGKIAKDILNFLEKEEINSIQNLEGRLGEFFGVGERGDILIESKISGPKEDYTINYINYELGIPFEIRMNSYTSNSKIIVKTNKELDNYESRGSDSFGNIIQEKSMKKCPISEIKKELRKLSS